MFYANTIIILMYYHIVDRYKKKLNYFLDVKFNFVKNLSLKNL